MLRLQSAGFTTIVHVGGVSVHVADGILNELGGVIINPLIARDQGIPTAEPLYVNLTGPAVTFVTSTNIELVPGQWFLVPPETEVWVNAATLGHKFTAFFSTSYTVPPAIPVPGDPASDVPGVGEPGTQNFPPRFVTGLTEVLPSYLYQQYTDDDDLQGFVEAQNQMQQDYVDTFNSLNLPIYPGPLVAGPLLDWVARGVYGMSRPVLGSGRSNMLGPLNTFGCNWLVPMWQEFGPDTEAMFGLNMIELYGPFDMYITDDDTYRRIITWHFFKQDGKYISVNWLKRRIWRFIWGKDGKSWDYLDPGTGEARPADSWPGSIVDPGDVFIADTKQISITFGVNRNITIRFVLYDRTVNKPAGGAMCNAFGCNGFEPAWGVSQAWDIGVDTTPMPTGIRPPAGIYINALETSFVRYPPLPFMTQFKQALDLGVIEMPYQFNYTCHIG
jgi:hypothetical protein